MVAWVSEQITNQQVVENLNKVARKVNQIGEKVYTAASGGGGSEKAASVNSPAKDADNKEDPSS